MDCLPDDVLKEILVKVPCDKSILRCTSVSKLWYSCIKSSAFITLHLSRPSNANYLVCDFKSPGKSSYVSIHHDAKSLDERNRLSFELSDGMIIQGCCNGLICYTKTSNGFIYLWNPTIRKVKEHPRYRDHGRSCFGFWFDKKVNDHMVAKISTEQGLCVDVYSLSTNSWRTVSESIPDKSWAADRDLAYVDGILHWPVGRKGRRTGSSERWIICSLDIKSGILKETLISSNKNLLNLYLTPLGEHSLAVFGSTSVTDSEEWTWTSRCCCMVQVYDQNLNKLYTIDLERETYFDLHCVVGLRNNGEALFLQFGGGGDDGLGLISCNTTTKAFDRFVWRLQYHKLHRVRPFTETLVLLDDGDAEEALTPNPTPTSNFSDFLMLCLCLSICCLPLAAVLVFLGVMLHVS